MASSHSWTHDVWVIEENGTVASWTVFDGLLMERVYITKSFLRQTQQIVGSAFSQLIDAGLPPTFSSLFFARAAWAGRSSWFFSIMLSSYLETSILKIWMFLNRKHLSTHLLWLFRYFLKGNASYNQSIQFFCQYVISIIIILPRLETSLLPTKIGTYYLSGLGWHRRSYNGDWHGTRWPRWYWNGDGVHFHTQTKPYTPDPWNNIRFDQCPCGHDNILLVSENEQAFQAQVRIVYSFLKSMTIFRHWHQQKADHANHPEWHD